MAQHELKDFHHAELAEARTEANVWIITRIAILWAGFLCLAPFVVEFTRG
jgi:hypothetical protein